MSMRTPTTLPIVVSGSHDATVRVWDLDARELLYEPWRAAGGPRRLGQCGGARASTTTACFVKQAVSRQPELWVARMAFWRQRGQPGQRCCSCQAAWSAGRMATRDSGLVLWVGGCLLLVLEPGDEVLGRDGPADVVALHGVAAKEV
jgi:hypothetical protein